MSELIFDSDVRAIGELDTENPLHEYIAFAMLPNKGSGDTLSDLVTSKTFDMAAGDVTWNADGSVSPTNAVTGHNSNDVSPGIVPKGSFLTHDVVFVVDVYFGGGNYHYWTNFIYLEQTTWHNSLSLMHGHQNKGFKARKDGGNDIGTTNINQRVVGVLRWSHSDNTFSLYENGTLVDSKVASTPTNAPFSGLYIGLGHAGDKLYSSNIFVKEGSFTPEEINGIITNPYQLFKRQQAVQDEYCLALAANTTANNYVSIDPVTLPASTPFKIRFTAKHINGNFRPFSDGSFTSRLYISEARTSVILTSENSGNVPGIDAIDGSATLPALGDWGEYEIVRDAANLITLTCNDTLIASGTATDSFVLSQICATTSISFGKSEYKDFYIEIDGVATRYWDFNQTRGDYAQDHFNGAIATLNNFPVDSGYVRAWGVGDGLEFDGVDDYVSIPDVSATSNNFTLEIKAANLEGVGGQCYLMGNDNFDYVIVEYGTSSEDIKFKALGVYHTIHGSSPTKRSNDGLVHTHTLTYDGVTLTYLLDGEVIGTTAATTAYGGFTVIGGRIGQLKKSIIQAVQYTDNNDNANSRYYDFTAIRGNSLTVPETINGQYGTLVGFPSNGVYVPEGSGEIVGYQFDGSNYADTASPIVISGDFEIPFSLMLDSLANNTYVFGEKSAWNNYLRFTNATNLLVSIGGTSGGVALTETLPLQKVLNLKLKRVGSVISLLKDDVLISAEVSISAGDFTIQRLMKANNGLSINGVIYSLTLPANTYDFTTGDDTRIIDTVGNNHATIAGGSTVKWQRVLPKEIYNVGAGQDYTTFDSFRAAQGKDKNTLYHAYLHELFPERAAWRWQGRFNGGIIIEGAPGKEYTGDKTVGAGFAPPSSTSATIDAAENGGVDVTLRNLRIFDGNQTAWSQPFNIGGSGSLSLNVEKCYVKADDKWKTNNAYYFCSREDANVDSCLLEGFPEGTKAGTFNNNIFINEVKPRTNGYLRDNSKGVNNLVFNGGNPAIDNAVAMSTDTNITGDISWLNAKHQITEAGRTAIGTDTGWNGSNICEWANAPIDAGGGVTIDFAPVNSVSSLDAFSLATSTAIDFNETSSTSTLDSVNISTSVAITFAGINSASTVDSFPIDAGVSIVVDFNTVNSTSSIDAVPVGTTASLDIDKASSTSTVDEPALTTSTNVGFNKVDSSSTLGDLIVSTSVTMTFTPVASASEVDPVSISTTVTLAFDAVQSATLLGQLDVTTQTVLTMNKVSTDSLIGQFSLYQAMGYFDLNQLAFSYHAPDVCQVCLHVEDNNYQLSINTENHHL